MLVMVWAGCGGGEVDLCRPGFLRAADGHCYPPPPETPAPVVEDVLDNLPPCFLHKPIGDIDLEAGCADGACVEQTIEQWRAALGGDADECTAIGGPLTSCIWDERRIAGLFDDDDDDGVPDPGGRTDRVQLLPGHPGSTLDGLGTEQGPRCWLEALGTPDVLTYEKVAGTLLLEEMYFDDLRLYVYDWETEDGLNHGDGLVDNIFLFGAD
jgi:hypothetical protein